MSMHLISIVFVSLFFLLEESKRPIVTPTLRALEGSTWRERGRVSHHYVNQAGVSVHPTVMTHTVTNSQGYSVTPAHSVSHTGCRAL